jgi:hypothetical protein
MSAPFVTSLIVENEVDFIPQMHYIFFQEPQKPGLNTDVFVWRRLDMQSKGSGEFSVPFDVEYQASITTSNRSRESSQRLPASSGDILSVTRDNSSPTSQAPMLEKTGNKEADKNVHYVSIQNNYEGDMDVQVTALKDKKPLVRETMTAKGDQAQFEIHSVVYIAWQADKKEGESFKSGTYAGKSYKIDLTDPKTGNPAEKITVTVSNKPGTRDISVTTKVVQ